MTRAIRRAAWFAGAPARLFLIACIRLYRVTLAGALGGQCRFHPSCSRYAESAIRTHGAVRGLGLGIWRVLRCNPFGRGGLEQVPAGRGYEAIIQEASP
ncbi:MAG: membrane protein insertion efficiency factor YidD [Actinomycetota bacterium]